MFILLNYAINYILSTSLHVVITYLSIACLIVVVSAGDSIHNMQSGDHDETETIRNTIPALTLFTH